METASEHQTRTGSPRQWWLAGLLSYLQPGLGQVYNGQGAKGLRFFGAGLISLAAMVLCLEIGSGLIYVGLFLLFAYLLITLVAIVDAALSARRQPDLFPRKPYNHWSSGLLICNHAAVEAVHAALLHPLRGDGGYAVCG